METIPNANLLQLEEMVQFLIRLVGKTNEKVSELERRIKELETEIYVQQGIMGTLKREMV